MTNDLDFAIAAIAGRSRSWSTDCICKQSIFASGTKLRKHDWKRIASDRVGCISVLILHQRKFKIVFDHKSLIWLFSVMDLDFWQICWRLKQQEYDYEIDYKADKSNYERWRIKYRNVTREICAINEKGERVKRTTIEKQIPTKKSEKGIAEDNKKGNMKKIKNHTEEQKWQILYEKWDKQTYWWASKRITHQNSIDA